MDEIILDVRGLTKRYPGFCLDQADLQLKRGSIHGLIGRNGAGKTTLIRSVLGFIPRDEGTVRVFSMDPDADACCIRQKIGYTGAGVFYPREKISTIAEVTRRFYPGWENNRWKELLRLFDLDENKCPAELSEGMKVKLRLALALAYRAELLILDEPTSGLDPVSRDELTCLFMALGKGGTTILFSTHITSDLEKCADHITYLKEGKVLLSAEKEAFLRHFEACGQGSTLEEILVNTGKDKKYESFAL